MGAGVGIRPKADGENIILTDTHRDLVDDITSANDEFGSALGEGIHEIAATAQSANTAAGELAGRVKALEERKVVAQDAEGRIQATDPAAPGDVATKRYVDAASPSEETISGMGWSAQRWGKHVTLFLTGVKENFTLPTQFRPASRVYASVAYGRATNDSRVGVMTHGAVELFGVNSNGAYATVSYLTN